MSIADQKRLSLDDDADIHIYSILNTHIFVFCQFACDLHMKNWISNDQIKKLSLN